MLEMAKGSRKKIILDASAIPLLPFAEEYAAMGMIPAGAYNNKKFCKSGISIGIHVDAVIQDLIFDPQTSGGLIISLPNKSAAPCLATLQDAGVTAAKIGEVAEDHPEGYIEVI